MTAAAEKLSQFLLATNFSWDDALDILLVSFLFYQLIQLIRGTRAFQMVLGTVVVVALYFLSRWTQLETLNWLLRNSLAYVGLAIIVLYQAELRKVLANLGKAPLLRILQRGSGEIVDEIVFTATTLARRKMGALLVLERDIGLRSYIEGGILLDAVISYDLLVSIFNPRAPLHDGAVIIQGDRVAAAACFLPLTVSTQLSRELGTRHRAAIGITEDTDAVAIVVSEETGVVSWVQDGNIVRGLDGDSLRAKLQQVLGSGAPAPSRQESALRERSVDDI
jgi:diadenylate cyclase